MSLESHFAAIALQAQRLAEALRSAPHYLLATTPGLPDGEALVCVLDRLAELGSAGEPAVVDAVYAGFVLPEVRRTLIAIGAGTVLAESLALELVEGCQGVDAADEPWYGALVA